MTQSIRDYMICWTGKFPFTADNPTCGKVALFPWPDRGTASRQFQSSSGACDMKIHKFNRVELQHFVLSTALGLIHNYNLDPAEVHRALWPLSEYRAALPPDTPCPPGGERHGRSAAELEAA